MPIYSSKIDDGRILMPAEIRDTFASYTLARTWEITRDESGSPFIFPSLTLYYAEIINEGAFEASIMRENVQMDDDGWLDFEKDECKHAGLKKGVVLVEGYDYNEKIESRYIKAFNPEIWKRYFSRTREEYIREKSKEPVETRLPVELLVLEIDL
ncbi:MAG: hypothetical protein HZB65_04415 [Candidatus Aenigmarchaeota archaeon]|nr:hypothetical protein [Candidatus Aenigmarchaeota archaeon]